MQHRLAALAATALVLAACQDAPAPVAPVDAVAPAATLSRARAAEPGAWIVVFRDDVRDVPGLARGLAAQHGGDVRFVYQTAIKGMALRNLPEQAIDGLRRNPNVAYVEPDEPVTLFTTQTNATWGIDRIDQADLPLSGTYDYTSTGAGVTAYIIDTGIRTSHNDFGGRASSGFDAVDGGAADDCNGHGTHVAGTVGGTTWGVAKGVTLVAVRVLDCNGDGTTGGVIAGIDWVTQHHTNGKAVANMSLGGGASTSLDQAVSASIADGVTYAVAAGNGNLAGIPQNACNYSPARVGAALTVGATTSSDRESSFSNYGSCVDILAPGSGITSAWYTSNTAAASISGTSMATPHVAGAVARYLEANAGATPATVASALLAAATPNTITLHSRSVSGGTPNRMLFVGEGGGTDPEPGSITLSVRAYKVKGARAVDLTWDGAQGSSVDIYRGGTKITTTANDGFHTDAVGGKGGGSFVYKVCESGSTTACSSEVTATF